MILGYGIIAVPTGIVSAEYVRSSNKADKENEANEQKNSSKTHEGVKDEVYPEVDLNTQCCSNCQSENHKDDARFCRVCGTNLY